MRAYNACRAISHASLLSCLTCCWLCGPIPLLTAVVVIQRAAMECKRDDESMRQFNKRVREGTAQLLKEEFKEHSSTNKRRKK